MKRAPNDCEPAGCGITFLQEQAGNSSLRERRSKEKKSPKRAAHVSRDRRTQQPARNGADEHDERRGQPAGRSPVPQRCKSREENERRNDRDEKQDVIEVEQSFERRRGSRLKAGGLSMERISSFEDPRG